MDRAEWLIDRLPDHGFRCIGHDSGAVQMIGVDRVGLVRRHRLVHDSDGHVAEPDIFPDRRGRAGAGGFGEHLVASVIVCQWHRAAGKTVDEVRRAVRAGGVGDNADREPLTAVIGICALGRRALPDDVQAAGPVDGIVPGHTGAIGAIVDPKFFSEWHKL